MANQLISKNTDDLRIGRRGAIDPSLGKSFTLEEQLMATAQVVGEHLERVYPGYPFYIRADGAIDGGCVLISIPRLTGNYRMIIRFVDLYSDMSMEIVTRKAGEILERFGLRRSKRDYAEWLECLRKHPRPAAPIAYRSSDGTEMKVTPDAVQ